HYSSLLLSCTAARFFFQAEDGIRDRNVTGVQTCALPISNRSQKSATALPMFRNAQLLTGIFPSMFLTPSCWEHFPIWGFLNDQRPGIKILPTWHWNGYIWPTTPNGKSRSYPADNNNGYLL